jgi:hypothetical protein
MNAAPPESGYKGKAGKGLCGSPLYICEDAAYFKFRPAECPDPLRTWFGGWLRANLDCQLRDAIVVKLRHIEGQVIVEEDGVTSHQQRLVQLQLRLPPCGGRPCKCKATTPDSGMPLGWLHRRATCIRPLVLPPHSESRQLNDLKMANSGGLSRARVHR